MQVLTLSVPMEPALIVVLVMESAKILLIRPAAVIVMDTIQDKNAVKEANVLRVPVFALCDTNSDPTVVKYPIPANDDSVKSVKLILDYFVEAVKEGKSSKKASPSQDKPSIAQK